MSGFVESVPTSEIAALAKKKRVPFVEDLGSGAVVAIEKLGNTLEHEPIPADTLKAGADLVCFSGDKLFGGPQAGVIAGRSRLVAALKRDPLFRALRCDKLVLAALQATVDAHLRDDQQSLPALGLLQIDKDELRARAAAIVVRLRGLPLRIMAGLGSGKVGGGSLPQSVLPSVTIDILPENCSVHEFHAALLQWSPPVLGFISGDRFKLDLRTIFPQQDDVIVDAIRVACSTTSANS